MGVASRARRAWDSFMAVDIEPSKALVEDDSMSHAYNQFSTLDERSAMVQQTAVTLGPSHSVQPFRQRTRIHSERTIISSIYARMSIDVAAVRIEHCYVDEQGQYLRKAQSGLNECLNVSANIDQGARHFRQDMPMTLFTEGVIAVVYIDTTADPRKGGSWDVNSIRVGTVIDWFPQHVKVRVYDERTAEYREIVVEKRLVGIVENPFYSVMNEPNSTLQRLVHKLSLMDNIDEISSQGKLDIIIQLPYVVKSETRRNEAEARVKSIQDQLASNTYGIAYTDGTEKITQLNRSVENNLLEQVKYLQEKLYEELGLTPGIMNGTADDKEMLNYQNRLIEPVMDAITEAIARTFLTKTARTQGQTIMYFQTPFKMLPITQLAEIADVLSRNQIATPNELRMPLGLKPSQAPQANELVNSNMPLDKQLTDGSDPATEDPEEDAAAANEAELDAQMRELGLA